MLRQELIKRSPIKIFEQSIHGGLGKGNLGVFTGRKGSGKTACLVHVSIDKMLRDQKVLHVSFAEDPRHIANWYDHVLSEIAAAYQMEDALDNREQVVHNRMILHFREKDVTLDHVKHSIEGLCEGAPFCPDIFIIDGFSFYDADEDDFNFWKNLARERDVAVWFSASLHRESLELDGRGIPAPVNRFSDWLDVIIMLQPAHDHVDLNLLKDRDSKGLERLKLKLDPKTLLISNHRV